MKRITILGSTGSIGNSALSVIERNPERFSVAGLSAHSNIDLLQEQAKRFKPKAVAVFEVDAAKELGNRLDIPVYSGVEGLERLASEDDADFVLSSIVGSAGLLPTLAAVRTGKTIGLANKETLVAAGDLVMAEADRTGAMILPVDSEHSAVFQCLEGRGPNSLSKIILTASGGPFAGKNAEELKNVTPEQALNHPSWSMGRKITVDSATLMNKGLEVIEASHLFGVGPDSIEVLIHRQSIIHSMVEFADGTLMAQMSVPDMCGAIAYAMSYPERLEGVMEKLDLASLGSLTFMEPDLDSFPCLLLAYEALRAGGTMPAVTNAANESAVGAFLDGKIGFIDIPVIIEKTMNSHANTEIRDIEGVLEADGWARKKALELAGQSRA